MGAGRMIEPRLEDLFYVADNEDGHPERYGLDEAEFDRLAREAGYVKIPVDAVRLPGHYWMNGERIEDPSIELILIPATVVRVPKTR